MPDFESSAVAQVFDSYPLAIRKQALRLRELIFEVAKKTPEVGCIEETLKWGEPAYVAHGLPARTGAHIKQSAKPQSGPRFAAKERIIGSAVRIGWKASDSACVRLLFHCQTTLVDSFRERFKGELCFEGNRAIVLDVSLSIPHHALESCIAAALTYHITRRNSG